MSSFATGTGDAVAARTRTDLKVFTDWLASNGVKGFIGEFGWPGSSNPGTDPIPGSGTGAHFDPRWDAVAQQWFLDADAAHLYTTNWTACEWNVDLRSYRTHDGNNRTFDYRTTVTSVLEQTYSTGGTGVIRGVNLAGGDFADGGPNGGLNLSSPGVGYYYPSVGDWAMLYSRGVRLVRLPFRWERLQTTLKQPLDPTQLSNLQAAVAAANKVGITVLLDMHNYGRYDTQASTNTSNSPNGLVDLGQNAPSSVGGTMLSCFTDVWTRLANAFKGYTIWYGLMNEPQGLTGGVQTWQTACQQVAEAIRLVDPTGMISVPGYFYATVPGWLQQNGSTAWLTEAIPSGQPLAGQQRNKDPNIVFEGHHYWDNDHSGGYGQTYDQELTNAQNQGNTAYSNSNYTAPATNNTQQTGLRVLFSSTYDGIYDFAGKYDGINANSNAVTFVNSVGNPSGSLKVTCTSTSDEGSIRKSLTGSVVRDSRVDFMIPTGSVLSSTQNFAITHYWRDDNSTDLVELRVLGSGNGYIVGLTVPSGSYTFVNTGATVLPLGTFQTLRVLVTDSAISLYLNGSSTAEASISGTFTNINIGGIARGKFYGTAYAGDMYYDNELDGITATYYAPPNGGFLTPLVSNLAATIGLLEFI